MITVYTLARKYHSWIFQEESSRYKLEVMITAEMQCIFFSTFCNQPLVTFLESVCPILVRLITLMKNENNIQTVKIQPLGVA